MSPDAPARAGDVVPDLGKVVGRGVVFAAVAFAAWWGWNGMSTAGAEEATGGGSTDGVAADLAAFDQVVREVDTQAAAVTTMLDEAAATVLAQTTDQAVVPAVEAVEPTVGPVVDVVEPVAAPLLATAEPVVQPAVEAVQPVVGPMARTLDPVTGSITPALTAATSTVVGEDAWVAEPLLEAVQSSPRLEGRSAPGGLDPTGAGDPVAEVGLIAPSEPGRIPPARNPVRTEHPSQPTLPGRDLGSTASVAPRQATGSQGEAGGPDPSQGPNRHPVPRAATPLAPGTSGQLEHLTRLPALGADPAAAAALAMLIAVLWLVATLPSPLVAMRPSVTPD
jgi:hypothetical protein